MFAGLNVGVALAWQLPALRPILTRYFLHNTASGKADRLEPKSSSDLSPIAELNAHPFAARLAPMLLCNISHMGPFHLAANLYVTWSFGRHLCVDHRLHAPLTCHQSRWTRAGPRHSICLLGCPLVQFWNPTLLHRVPQADCRAWSFWHCTRLDILPLASVPELPGTLTIIVVPNVNCAKVGIFFIPGLTLSSEQVLNTCNFLFNVYYRL